MADSALNQYRRMMRVYEDARTKYISAVATKSPDQEVLHDVMTRVYASTVRWHKQAVREYQQQRAQ